MRGTRAKKIKKQVFDDLKYDTSDPSVIRRDIYETAGFRQINRTAKKNYMRKRTGLAAC